MLLIHIDVAAAGRDCRLAQTRGCYRRRCPYARSLISKCPCDQNSPYHPAIGTARAIPLRSRRCPSRNLAAFTSCWLVGSVGKFPVFRIHKNVLPRRRLYAFRLLPLSVHACLYTRSQKKIVTSRRLPRSESSKRPVDPKTPVSIKMSAFDPRVYQRCRRAFAVSKRRATSHGVDDSQVKPG